LRQDFYGICIDSVEKSNDPFGFRVVAPNNRQNWLATTPDVGLNLSKCAISATEFMFTTQDPEESKI